jgi:hypothetical protein
VRLVGLRVSADGIYGLLRITAECLYGQVSRSGQTSARGRLGMCPPPRSTGTSMVFVQLSDQVKSRLTARFGTSTNDTNLLPSST